MIPTPDFLRIGWWSPRINLVQASTRLRSALVMHGLAERGLATDWYAPEQAGRFSTIVMRRCYDDASLQHMCLLKDQGRRVVVDLCDNDFGYMDDAARVRAAIAKADVVVAATDTLAKIIRQECPDTARLVTIGDLFDDLSIVPTSPLKQLRSSLRRDWILRKQKQLAVDHTRLVWFGTSGNAQANSGIADIGCLRPELEAMHRRWPLHLSVISNKRRKYRDSFSGSSVPRRYIEWNALDFEVLLRAHDIALIPAKLNDFTLCKTDNRLVTALRAGVAVVASPLPSYAPFAHVTQQGDIAQGLQYYLQYPALRRRHVARAADTLDEPGRKQMVLDAWENVLGR